MQVHIMGHPFTASLMLEYFHNVKQHIKVMPSFPVVWETLAVYSVHIHVFIFWFFRLIKFYHTSFIRSSASKYTT